MIRTLVNVYARVFTLAWLFFFSPPFLYSFSIDRLLLRDIISKNQTTTEHFYIYWSDDYLSTYPWLVKVDERPLYIDTLIKKSEEVYQSFLDEGFDMPERIEIYVANTGITADGLLTNSIASLGAFTSDDYPEILINANLSQKSLSSDIKRILTHEMMHVVQYQNGIIKDEVDTPKEDMWFTEGLSVLSEVYFMDDTKYMNEYSPYLFDGGFFDTTNYINSYTNGYLFYYLMKLYGYDLKEFLEIFKNHDTSKSFIDFISTNHNLGDGELIQDIY
ncbi:MAG: hypothetical protein JXQ66_03780, partial [Campylobacterales bacterium]|nr:hypothetical protein [Campylobacterales bacterium]